MSSAFVTEFGPLDLIRRVCLLNSPVLRVQALLTILRALLKLPDRWGRRLAQGAWLLIRSISDGGPGAGGVRPFPARTVKADIFGRRRRAARFPNQQIRNDLVDVLWFGCRRRGLTMNGTTRLLKLHSRCRSGNTRTIWITFWGHKHER